VSIEHEQSIESNDDIIVIKDLNKWYGAFHVLKDINLRVKKGERIVICGPSGSGKSTMIRCINRLEEFQRGSLIVNGVEMIEDVKNIEAIRREVGMVFQHFNLFPHLTILENLTLGPIWVQKKPKKEAEATAMKYLERVKIPDQALKFPGQLSGGQQQRVAIARSLCMNPEIMLFDEPTSALDRTVQKQVIALLRSIQAKYKISFMFISHDLAVVRALSHRIIVMRNGQIVESGDCEAIFTHPKEDYTKTLIDAAFLDKTA
jgi:general L-amino acid transport system ATP-binding protein